MKELLEKYYKIKVDNYYAYNNGIIFFLNGDYYYFVETVYDDDYINMIVDIVIELKNKIRFHEFILNKDGAIKSNNYVLLKINGLIDDINLVDINNFCLPIDIKYNKYFVNMVDFWYKKIDYLEMQIVELSDNLLINNSFDYYIGISELLLIYLNKNMNNYNLYLSHKVFNSISNIDFYNPLNITFDSKYRDIAYYIRATNDIDLLFKILDNMDKNEYVFLFVRLVFPFEYFNALNEVLIDKKDENCLIKIVNNIDSYEQWIKKISDIFGIHIFNWIEKKEVIY